VFPTLFALSGIAVSLADTNNPSENRARALNARIAEINRVKDDQVVRIRGINSAMKKLVDKYDTQTSPDQAPGVFGSLRKTYEQIEKEVNTMARTYLQAIPVLPEHKKK
jgi:hypothetical protein